LSAIKELLNSSTIKKSFSNGIVVALVILVVVLALYISALHSFNMFMLNDLLNNAVVLAIAAAGLTLVVLTGGFDMSVGGVIVLTNCIVAVYANSHGILYAVVLGLLVGLIVGAINGYVVAYLKVQSIVATLATMIMCEGIALVILPAPGGVVSSASFLSLMNLIGGVIPTTGLIALIVLLIWLWFKRTVLGTNIYAIGADERAAEQSGISVKRTKFIAFLIAGVLYAVAGIIFTARITSGDPTSSGYFIMLVFAAVAIGGTSFSGGKGGVVGSIIGAIILTALQKMLFAVGVSSFYTGIFQGAILILAVLIGNVSTQLTKGGKEH